MAKSVAAKTRRTTVTPKKPERMTNQEYADNLSTWNALREEVVFILTEAINDAEIKIHTVESRIKDFDSLSRKTQERSGGTTTDISDIVGARAICLFKSDLDRIGQIIEEQFDILKKDDKVTFSEDSFGYMSVHYIGRMKSSHQGPRYNKIKDLVFEIQVRTLCMHAWAAISHYLDYKAEWDIPAHLRKGLNALSGLFYVADEQYERLYDARQESREDAENKESSELAGETAINLDTVSAFLQRKFPDRNEADSTSMSRLVRELIESEYRTLEKVEHDVDSAKQHLEKEDMIQKKNMKVTRDLYFNNVGAVRISLASMNPKFAKVMA